MKSNPKLLQLRKYVSLGLQLMCVGVLKEKHQLHEGKTLEGMSIRINFGNKIHKLLLSQTFVLFMIWKEFYMKKIVGGTASLLFHFVQ